MAIEYDFDDTVYEELNFESDSLDCRLGILQFDDDLQLEFEEDEEDFFPMVNYDPDEDEEVEEKPKKRKRTIWPCKK